MKVKILLTSLLIGASLVSYAKTSREKINVNGTTREMKVHVPDGTPDGAPLVIACHGANQSAEWHDSNSKWTDVSDANKFVLVFPDAINSFWDISGNSDVNFITAIIDDMHERYNTSLTRVYLSGFSMGGMLTYHCANRIPDRIAAFVPVSGYPMGDKSAYGPRPVPILHVHGTGDDVCVFSGVQPTLDNWIERNQCNKTPVVIKPYPSNKPNSGATLTKWTDGLDGVEVQLLQFADKGHWQSEDPVHCLTSEEAWAFMKRWSLGPDAPRVKSVDPEDGSFDLPTDGFDITMTFDMNVSADGVEAEIVGEGTPVALQANADGDKLIFSVPALEAGIYKLTVRNVKGESGGEMKVFRAEYTFGYEEVGETVPYNVVFEPDLAAAQSEVGEGIPFGWYRINTRSNNEKDEKGSGSANTGGARMKYFMQGGDFDAGFYLSARDYDMCEITYGRYTPQYALHFDKGRYVATFNSAYWNEGSMDGNVKFDFVVRTLDANPVASFTSLPSSSNLGEQTGRIEGSYSHSCEFEIEKEADYTVTYRMTAGWAAVIVGNLRIVTAMSAAERYKGAFMRTLAEAKALYNDIPEENRTNARAVTLANAIQKYEGLVSTAPSVYEKAISVLRTAMKNASSLSGIDDVTADARVAVAVDYFNLLGQPLAHPADGISIRRTLFDDGSVTIEKVKL